MVIPTYNRASLVGRAISNALTVIAPGDEILVVDDGSTDATAAVVTAFGAPVRYLPVPHGGAGPARNHGIRSATRPLIAFLDSDDEWMPDKLQLQRTLLERRTDVLFSFTDIVGRSAQGEQRRFLRQWHHDPRPWDEILGPGFWYSSIAPLPPGRGDFRVHVGSMYLAEMQENYIATTSLVVRRERGADALQFDAIALFEDKACFARLAAAGPAAYLDCETSWQWEHTGPRLTDQDNLARATARIQVMESIWGRDAAFLAVHRAAYEEKLREQRLMLTRGLIARGQTAEARAELRRVAAGPWSYRLLAALPGPLVRGVLGARRALGL